MALDTTISLTTLAAVKSFLGSSPTKDGIWIYCDAVAATAATARVTDTTLILIITGGGSAGTTTLTFADANKDTVAELVTAINAVSGWKSGAIYNGAAASTDLVVTGALPCLTSANEITLKIEDNYTLEELINRASDFINRFCWRTLKSTSYSRHIYYGMGERTLMLEQFPVTRVARVSVGRTNAFSIRNTSTDANFATVEVTSTKIRLIVNGGTNADDSELTLADYATIDLLITAIEALGKGWACTAMATEETARKPATELLIRPAMGVTAVTQAYCEIVDDELTDYKLLKPSESRNEGVIERSGIFIPNREYFIDYTAGYLTIPYTLEQSCLFLIKYKYDSAKRDAAMKSEKFGEGADYSYTVRDVMEAIPPDLQDELSMFKRRSF